MNVAVLILFVLLLVVLLAPLLLPRRWLVKVPAPLRILAGLGALAAAAFCGFGFLATFEPLDPATQWGFRIFYGLAGLAAIGGALRLFRTRTPSASL